MAYAMIAGPGKNPPASHLDEPDFDLRRLHPSIEHVDAVQQFFFDHITQKPAQTKSQTAEVFAARIDALLSLYKQRRGEQQVFSMVLTHSTSWIAKETLPMAQNLRVWLPTGVTRLKGSIRFHTEAKWVEGPVQVSVYPELISAEHREALRREPERLKELEGTALALLRTDVGVGGADAGSLGMWWDFEIPVAKTPIPRRAFFNIDKSPDAHITAVMLVAEFMA